jgi:CBS domain containing-hemolysin-like protein
MVHIRDFLDFLAMRADSRASRRKRDGEDGASQPTPSRLPPSLGRVDLSMTLADARILRPVLYVPRSMPAIDLLVRMQATRTHMALVIDEYGGTDGLVSIEDLVEMVVGDIEDEHDDATARMIVRGDNDTFIADARASLEEVTEALGIDLSDEDSAEDIDTLGGLIVTLAGRVPTRGELIAGPDNLEFEVLDADPRRLKRLRIHRRGVVPPIPAAIAVPAAAHTIQTRPAPPNSEAAE